MECPAHLVARSRDGGVGFARQSDQRGAPLEVGPPGRRQTGLARGTLEQPRSQARLERRKPPAHGRLGSREAVRRRGEASRLDDGDEHLDVLDAGHEREYSYAQRMIQIRRRPIARGRPGGHRGEHARSHPCHRQRDGVATVTLARPEKKNALSIALRDEVSDAIDALGRDDDRQGDRHHRRRATSSPRAST